MSRKQASTRHLGRKLTPLEERFCQEYIIDFVGAYALGRAGSSASPENRKQQAYEMLRKPKIVERITQLMAARSEKAQVDSAWVLAELVKQYRLADMALERKTALSALKDIGQHVDVNAFRVQVGVGNPDGTAFNYDALSDDEQDILERLLVKAAAAPSADIDGPEGVPRPTVQ